MTATAAEPFAEFFDGTGLVDKQHLAAYLVVTTEDGWPHTAMISAGELLITADGTARLALWPSSRTASAVRRTRRAVVLIVLGDLACRARLTLAETSRSGSGLALFAGPVGPHATRRWLSRRAGALLRAA